jgi:hypothetical protein
MIFSTVAAKSSYTTSKCSIARLSSLAEVACVSPALSLIRERRAMGIHTSYIQ